MRTALPIALALALLALPGCDSAVVAPNIEDIDFAPSLNVNLAASTQTESGLYYRDLKEGTGTAATPGRIVFVRYTGWFVNGGRFDGNEQALTPFEFPLGAGRVIKGWDEGVEGMRVGGVRQLVIPPHLGYGRQQMGPIPPNSVLVFRVEVVGLQ